MTEALIIFAKNPVLGKVKTRIGRVLGHEKAVAIYQELMKKTQYVTAPLEQDKIVYYSDFIDQKDTWDNTVYQKRRQFGNHLGARMANAIAQESGSHHKVVIIGTDIYDLSAEIISAAFERLDAADVVLGPAEDGGYYLIGMKETHRPIFDLQAWSTPQVLRETLEIIEDLGLSYALLPPLNDIDEPNDLYGTPLEYFLPKSL